MEIMFIIIFFIFGSVMGSFYHVVATRVSNDESIVFPASHCTKCNHKLKWYENIPIISYILLRGKCSSCCESIGLSYLIVEIVTGILFGVCFHSFKFSFDLLVAIIFISCLIIVIVSDIEYMIILDEVLIFGTFSLILSYVIYFVYTMGLRDGVVEVMVNHIYPAMFAFLSMYALKIMGDKMFHKESLGGGDIKLMFLFGLVLGYALSICTIFLATFIAFPIALILLFVDRDNIIPFGPFLSMAAILIFVSKLDIVGILSYLVK